MNLSLHKKGCGTAEWSSAMLASTALAIAQSVRVLATAYLLLIVR